MRSEREEALTEKNHRQTAMYFFVGFLGCIISSNVKADEEMIPIAMAGDWVAMAHHTSSISAPDMCVAVSTTKKAIIRADSDNIEFRVVNEGWSLPTSVTGVIEVSVANHEEKFDITSNSGTMVSAEISREKAIDLLDEMTKASSMSVKTGKDKPYLVSLAGSNRVLSAFRTCASLKGSSGGGTNPF